MEDLIEAGEESRLMDGSEFQRWENWEKQKRLEE